MKLLYLIILLLVMSCARERRYLEVPGIIEELIYSPGHHGAIISYSSTYAIIVISDHGRFTHRVGETEWSQFKKGQSVTIVLSYDRTQKPFMCSIK
jgi:hypothetical protein